MSELFIYESDDDNNDNNDNNDNTSKCEDREKKLIQKTESEVGDQTIENTSPSGVHNNKLKFPLSHNGGVG